MAAFAGNTALCKITEDLIFTDPYRIARTIAGPRPSSTASPPSSARTRELKVAVSRLKLQVPVTSPRRMIHGDLHTGSVMVTEADTRVIDPEFAFFGPMGFDVGAVIGNLLISYFSQDGHETAPGERDDYRDWILATILEVWTALAENSSASGARTPRAMPIRAALFDERARSPRRWRRSAGRILDRLFSDSLGFAAAKMIRRILGLAHNIDLEWIEDPGRRAACEMRALRLARQLIVDTASYRTIDSVVDAARLMRAL